MFDETAGIAANRELPNDATGIWRTKGGVVRSLEGNWKVGQAHVNSIDSRSPPYNPTIYRAQRLLVSDLLVITFSIALSFVAADTIRVMLGLEYSPNSVNASLAIFGISFLVVLISGFRNNHYTIFKPFWMEAKDILYTVLIIILVQSAFMYLVRDHHSRLWLALHWGLLLLVLPVTRLFVHRLYADRSEWHLPTILIGSSIEQKDVVSRYLDDEYLAYNVREYLHTDLNTSSSKLGDLFDYLDYCDKTSSTLTPYQKVAPHIVITTDSISDLRETKYHVDKISSLAGHVTVVPPECGMPLHYAEVLSFHDNDAILLRFSNKLNFIFPRLLKRSFDLIIGLAVTLTLSPILLVIYILLYAERRENPIFKHKRLGYNGKTFSCLKFKTMASDSEKLLQRYLAKNAVARKEWEKYRKLKNDPRVSKIGAFLRRTSLDELPQLINVIRGEMSLVGPRPIVAEEVKEYGEHFYFYCSLKPGITGLWQISGRSDLSFTERKHLDTWYIKSWSLWNDFIILLKTARILFHGHGAY